MTAIAETAPATDRELVLTRIIDAPREKLFRAWTDPELLKQWFAPLPYTTPVAELDVRPGGADLVVMRGPDGKDLPNRGVYLEVVRERTARLHRRLHQSVGAITEAVHDRDPDLRGRSGGKTRYTARVRHWTVADREAHEKMGFHERLGPLHRPARGAGGQASKFATDAASPPQSSFRGPSVAREPSARPGMTTDIASGRTSWRIARAGTPPAACRRYRAPGA